jgi:3'-phosphoadenosine 5'-phosphosulfate sulfotransferase (PAPS reductase)/FAD synthetase
MKHIVGLSGGIDSQAAALWVRNRFGEEDTILLNSNAGKNEHELTMGFIDEYSAAVHRVERVFAISEDISRAHDRRKIEEIVGAGNEVKFDDMAAGIGIFPSQRNQFCTMYLKLAPQRRWHEAHPFDGDWERYTGVRRDESRNRKDTPFREWDDYFGCYVNNPLADWTKQMCFDYVLSAGEAINPLYSLGFSRVGCAPCVNANKEDIKLWASRFPEVIDKVRGWEQRTGRTFFQPLMPGITPRLLNGKPTLFNWIDEVVAWAQTDFGGKQFNIFGSLPRPSCESKYGLCE